MTDSESDPKLAGIVQMMETALTTLKAEFPGKREAAKHLDAAVDSLKASDEGIHPEDLSSANDG